MDSGGGGRRSANRSAGRARPIIPDNDDSYSFGGSKEVGEFNYILFLCWFFSINCESRNQKPSFLHKYVYLFIYQAPIVQTLDSAIHRINHYPVDKYYGNQLRYPLDSDLSCGKRYPTFEQPGPEVQYFTN